MMLQRKPLQGRGWLIGALGIAFSTALGWAAPTTAGPAAPPVLPARMRGVAILAYGFTPESARRMAADHINCVRLQIDARPLGHPVAPTAADPLLPYRQDLAFLHQTLPLCAKLGLHVIVTPGNLYGRKLDVFWKQADDARRFRAYLPQFWTAFAREFKNYPALVAYDVFNEPNYPPGGQGIWYDDMLPNAIAAIRKINPTIWLVVEPGPWAFPEGFQTMPLVHDPYVIYSFHWYYPHGYTHQYLRSQNLAQIPRDRVYPGVLRMFYDNPIHKPEYWNKQTMQRYLQPVVDFQRQHHVRILVGEFGVIRWAPGAAQWLADSMSLFEQHGWDWCVIGYPTPWAANSPDGSRTWTGWNLSYPAADPRIIGPYLSGKTSDRMQVLQQGWRANSAQMPVPLDTRPPAPRPTVSH